MLVLQVLSDSKSPDEDKREERADGTRVVCANGTRRVGCATCIALRSRFVGGTQGETCHIDDYAQITRSGHIFRG